MREELKLIPLRIPAGWTIELNKLTEVNPNEFKTSDYEYVWEFDEDIMFLTYRELEYSIDLGWYPSFDPSGEYCIRVIKDDNWDNPIEEFTSREINEIKNKIEYLLEKYNL